MHFATDPHRLALTPAQEAPAQKAPAQRATPGGNTAGSSKSIQRILASLQQGRDLNENELKALRLYKCAVAELQAYSDTELAELGIARHDIFLTAIDWHTGYYHRQLRSVA